MTGPEHYREAELLLEGIDNYDVSDPAQLALANHSIALAQAHFTAAQVAATAEAGGLDRIGSTELPTTWARAFEGASL